jgi:hypothetical protein
MRRVVVATCLAWLAAADPAISVPRLEVAGAEEVVFAPTQRCDRDDIPDAPLRAFRRPDGTIRAFAAHWNNLPFTVSAGVLARHCATAFGGGRRDDPAAYDDRGWLIATWRLDTLSEVVAIVHNEYHGQERPARCRFRSYAECWENALTLALSRDAGERFVLPSPDPSGYVVARGPLDYARSQGARYGFYNPSNILFQDGYFYVAASMMEVGGRGAGVCLMRTPDIRDPAAWRGWDGSDFRAPLSRYAPGTQAMGCRPLPGLVGQMGSFVRIAGTGYVAAITLRSDLGGEGQSAAIAYALSRNMIDWSEPRRLMQVDSFWTPTCRPGDAARYHYPSVIDLDSPSVNFDEIGRAAQLYMTRARLTECRITMDRDLVRIPLRVTVSEGAGSVPP